MNVNKDVFKCFSLDYLNQRDDLNKCKVREDFLKCDLSIFNEREIVTSLINNESFSKEEKELIRVWATILKSKKLFEIADGSGLTDIEFDTKLKEFSCSELFMKNIYYIDWKYATIDVNNEYISSVEGFYEEIVFILARNNTLTVELVEEFDLRGVNWNYMRSRFDSSLLACLCKKLTMDLLVCLVDKEIDINIQNIYGETAFMGLCSNEFVTLDMIKLFFDKFVDLDNHSDKATRALMLLCNNKAITLDMIKLFFDKGVDINLEDVNSKIALMWLCENKSVTFDMIKLFFDRSVDLVIREVEGLSSLDFYIRHGGQNEEILRLLGQS